MKKQRPFNVRLEDRLFKYAENYFRQVQRHIGNPDVVTQFCKAAGSFRLGVLFEDNKMVFRPVEVPKPPSYEELAAKAAALEAELEQFREQKP